MILKGRNRKPVIVTQSTHIETHVLVDAWQVWLEIFKPSQQQVQSVKEF